MARSKLKQCKSCGHEISARGKVICPSCGAVNKKPIYKRIWFITLVVLVVFGAIGSLAGDDEEINPSNGLPAVEANENSEASADEPTIKEDEKKPLIVTVDELYDLLADNPLKASDTYLDQYVQLTGDLSNIDAQGDYFSLSPMKSDWTLRSVHCRISKEHLDTVMEFSMDQRVTVVGTISDVGEILGYTLKVESILSEPISVSSGGSNDNEQASEPSGDVEVANEESNETEEESVTEQTDSSTSETLSQKNAVRSAKEYLDLTAFSRDGLIMQLEFEGFGKDDAIYGVDHCEADWMEQALISAVGYLDLTAFSESGLEYQLEFEGFTADQAIYGVEHCGADWMEQAAKSAREYLNFSSFSRSGLIDQLKFDGFSDEQATYGVDAVGL